MEHAVEQPCVQKIKFQDKMENVLKDNERLLEQVISIDIRNIVVHDYVNSADKTVKRNNLFSEQGAPTFDQLFKINDLKAQSQEKDTALKETLSKLKGKAIVNEVVPLHSIDHELLKIDVALLAPKLRNNRTAHADYLRHTQEETATLREIVESERLLNPLNTSLDYAYHSLKAIPRMIGFSEHQVVQIVLWYLDSGCSKHMTEDRSQLINFVQKFLGTVKFGKDHVAKIMGYGDYKIGNVMISKCKLLAVGSPFFWQWEHPPLAVGTYTASGNSLLEVGMPYAFYSQQREYK
nr:integrase, catalytic region, zinc finger, CCHC-type, peptidase aspartic, catalytic [Tanacetum cinerariifolium]